MDVVNSPVYSTGVGLVLYGAANQRGPAAFRGTGIILKSRNGWENIK
jgi:hypothetical protein